MPKRVLIAEDNPDLRKMMMHLIRSFGYDTVTAANGRQAVERAEQFPPDLILMDIMMPEMDGLEATKIIRSSSENNRMPIIAVTAFDRDHHFRAFEAGCDEVIPKPIDFDHFRSIIRRHLRETD